MRASLVLAINLALMGGHAARAAAESPAEAPESIVEFTINGQPQTATLVVRRDRDGTLLLRADDFASSRLRKPANPGISIDGVEYHRLDASIGAEVRFDAATQHADVVLPPQAFETTRAVASRADTLPPLTTSPGGFLNYELYAESTTTHDTLGGIAEAGVFGRYGVGTTRLLSREDLRGRSQVRLDTTWTLDLPQRLASLRVGDAISVAGAWGRSVRFGGIQFGTNFATQPTLVTTPLLAAEGTALVPSTVDVFVNGNRVASQDVPPGPFTIDHVPAVTGGGQMQVVVTDALGRQQVIAQPYYSGSALLRAGLQEYSFELGALREDYGSRSDAYGDAMAAATYRRGVTDRLTAEAHAEVQVDGGAAAGIDVAWQVGQFGIVTATAAAGGVDDVGWLAGLGLEHAAARFSLFARSQFTSESFAQFATVDLGQRPRQRTFAGLGFDFGRYGNAQVAYGLQSYWTGPRQETIGVTHSLTLGRAGYLNLILSQTLGAARSTDMFLNWSLPLGERRTAGLSVRHSPDATDEERLVAVASMQQSLPGGTGVGYQASLASNDEAQLGLSAQTAVGSAGLQYARRGGTDGWRVDASGALAFTAAGVMPARRLDRSFAVVRVADYEGMTVYVENQPIGRTDRAGRVLLDGLRAYERNEISLDPRELPMDASLAVPVMEVTPAFRSGALVDFPVTRTRSATLHLVRDDGSPVPVGSSVSVGNVVVPVGYAGLVYLENVAGGVRGSAAWSDGACEFELQQPDGADPVPDLGTVSCRNVTP